MMIYILQKKKRKGDSGDSGELEIKKRNEFKTKLKNEKKKKLKTIINNKRVKVKRKGGYCYL